MGRPEQDHTLENLLDLDGDIYVIDETAGYWVKFAVRRVTASSGRPHGVEYSPTMHDSNNRRLVGFDNAHGVPAAGSRYKRPPDANDHWHRTEEDPGRPYQFRDAETLVDDFFAEVERVLSDRGIGTAVIKVEETRRSK